MIDGYSVLGLIPARGGSKGVPRKNLRLAGGVPLIGWTISEARRSRHIDRLVLTSEDPEIIAVAESLGCEAPFQRPAALAADDTPGMDPVLHALECLPHFDFIVLLQPTSPLRVAADIDACIELCVAHQADACVSVVKCKEHPYLMFRQAANSRITRLLGESAKASRRQDYPDVFLLNGAVYVARTTWLCSSLSFIGDNTISFEMPLARSLDIDTEEDFIALEKCLVGRKACS